MKNWLQAHPRMNAVLICLIVVGIVAIDADRVVDGVASANIAWVPGVLTGITIGGFAIALGLGLMKAFDTPVSSWPKGVQTATGIAGAVAGGYVLGVLEVVLTAVPGLGDILPAATTAPGVIQFFKTYLPGSLTSYRDAFVFIVLILLLLVRPGGILGTSDNENTR